MEYVASTARESWVGAITAFVVALLAPLTLAHLSAATVDQLHPDVAWFPYLMVAGVLAAALAFAIVGRSGVRYRRAILVVCGLVLIALGLGFLSGPRYWGIDYSGRFSLLFAAVALTGGAGVVLSQLPVQSDTLSLPNGRLRQVKQVPLGVVLAVALVVMFVATGPVARALALVLLASPIPGSITVVLAQALRGGTQSWAGRATYLLVGLGGVLVLVGLAGHSIGCVGIGYPDGYVYDVSYVPPGEVSSQIHAPAGMISYHTCSNVLQPLPFVTGWLLLILGPVATSFESE